MNQENSKKVVSRRQLLENAGILGGALVLGKVAGADEPKPPVEIADAPDFVLKLADAPELEKVGGWKIVEIGADSVIIARTPDGLTALSAICTHKGCKVEYQSAERQFVCPCHKARFGEDGKVVRGPAKLPLAPYSATRALLVAKKQN